MKRNDIEFKVGEVVVFQPYERPMLKYVVGVDVEKTFSWNGEDERIFYALDQYPDTEPRKASTFATGLSIPASKYYEADPDGDRGTFNNKEYQALNGHPKFYNY